MSFLKENNFVNQKVFKAKIINKVFHTYLRPMIIGVKNLMRLGRYDQESTCKGENVQLSFNFKILSRLLFKSVLSIIFNGFKPYQPMISISLCLISFQKTMLLWSWGFNLNPAF